MKTKRAILLLVLLVVAWAFFGVFGERLSSSIAARYGAKILARGDGKFVNVQNFVHQRMKEGAVIATAAFLLVLAHRALSRAARRRFPAPLSWIFQAWSAFICINIGIGIAAQTVLFWSLLYTGKGTSDNYTQWKIKQGLMKECETPAQAVLLGASQTRTQIDTKVLNQRLGARLWTTELQFPGSTPHDMTLALDRLPAVRLDYVITYASEAMFHTRTDNSRFMYFFGWRDLIPYLRFGPGKPPIDENFTRGLLGDTFPLYRVWDPLLVRIKGFERANEQQARRDAALPKNLEQRAREAAVGFGFGPECDFKKERFIALRQMCRERGARLVVCCGQVNPILQRALDPAVRPDMLAFLREQARSDSNILLLDEAEIPLETVDEYEDLTHVNAAARERFSIHLANRLAEIVLE